MKTRFDNDKVYFTIDTWIFSKEVIQKCFYWYTAEFFVDFNFLDDRFIEVSLVYNTDQKYDETALVAKIAQDLNDFSIRETVNHQTKIIRELIVAKAFANFEENQEGFSLDDVSDPLGFKL
ncbi:His-Xaa-Ser system protein HxsD [Pedobacter antarcticus]|uniref:His-Xaa-Ser system protein HxsD n=1 Tax=Pedobacter antarcticus TaxID=34086 RepID=UPI000881D44A|nr:His-Xaa-Ser system protein HxsD [Pedobacter antarcticus]SDM53187.1 His-Xaa-Ser system protein HxsD [Pedobacter antarcticus]